MSQTFGICSAIHCGHFGINRETLESIARNLIENYNNTVRVFINPSMWASRSNYAEENTREFDNMADLLAWLDSEKDNTKTARGLKPIEPEEFAEAVEECARIIETEPETWETPRVMWECFGKLGSMSPKTRAAFASAFGEAQAERIEAAARAILAEKAERKAQSNYAKHAAEADKAEGVPALGSFVWGFSSCLKCDGGRGILSEIHSELMLLEDEEYTERPRLCRVDKVITVTPEELDRPELADELAAAEQLPGGWNSEDTDTAREGWQYTGEELETFYTLGAVVTDGARWFLIDSEGHNYPRYIYKPQEWREMFCNFFNLAVREREDRHAAEEAEKAADYAKRRAAYDAECEKFAPFMKDLQPLKKAQDEAREAVRAIKFAEYGSEKHKAARKAAAAADRAMTNGTRANILAMARAAFPGVDFKCTTNKAWSGYRLTWEDGPTKDELNAACPLHLFTSCMVGFDGMTDCTTYEHALFTDFADKYGCFDYGQVETERSASDDCRECIASTVREVLSLPKDEQNPTISHEQAAEFVGATWETDPQLHDISIAYIWNLSDLVHQIFCRTSFYVAPTDPTTPTTPDNGGKGGKATEPEQVESEGTTTAPEGLQLVAIAEGVAVTGDTRATYRNRKAIKAHGAKWNKDAQQWQATDPESVAALRKWFGLSDEQPTTEEAEPEQPAEATAPRFYVYAVPFGDFVTVTPYDDNTPGAVLLQEFASLWDAMTFATDRKQYDTVICTDVLPFWEMFAFYGDARQYLQYDREKREAIRYNIDPLSLQWYLYDEKTACTPTFYVQASTTSARGWEIWYHNGHDFYADGSKLYAPHFVKTKKERDEFVKRLHDNMYIYRNFAD